MTNKKIEQYLKELRNSSGYSQEFVASHLNITRQTYSHYETGRINPPINSLYNLAKLYGIPVDNFLELVVTYNINKDFIVSKSPGTIDSSAELSLFMEYISSTEKEKKFKFLDSRERRLLYYFQLLETRDQDDILDFLKIKYQNRKKT